MRVQLSTFVSFLLAILLWIVAGMAAPGAVAAEATDLPVWSASPHGAPCTAVVSSAPAASPDDRVAILEDERDPEEERDHAADPGPVYAGPRGLLRWDRPPAKDTTGEAATPVSVLVARQFQLSLAARGPPRPS